MNLIASETLESFYAPLDERLHRLDQSEIVDLDNPCYGAAFRWYLLFTHASDLIPEISEDDVFYNRYLWVRRFALLHQSVHGVDVGIEQQVFQLLERANVEVNWSFIQQIDELVESKS